MGSTNKENARSGNDGRNIVPPGRFFIEAQIGEGATGRVYRARDTAKAMTAVALKVLTFEVATEWETLASVNATWFAELYETGLILDPADGRTPRPFISMELLKGSSLKDQPPDPESCGDIIKQCCRAMAYLHGRGIGHFDLKPSNVFVAHKGNVPEIKILDFGLAAKLLPGGVIPHGGTYA